MRHSEVTCKKCNSKFGYKLNDIFTHLEFPFVWCPKCSGLVIVDENPNDIYKEQCLKRKENEQ